MILKTAAEIDAPRDEVFAFFTDFAASAIALHSAVSNEFVSGNWTGLGAEWIQTDDSEGELTVARHKIIAFHPPDSYSMTSDDEHALETMDFRFTDHGETTLVAFDLTVRAKRFWHLPFLVFGKPLIHDAMRTDLARIKNVIEEKRRG